MPFKRIPEYENQYMGMSTDQKPENVPVYSLFVELDTGDVYYWDGSDWAEFGGDA